MKRNVLGIAAFGLISLGAALAVRADVKLPHVIGSHMVVQQQRPVVIWGWADPGEAVTVSLDRETAQSTADSKGNWKTTLPALEADGQPHRVTVSGKNKIELDDLKDIHPKNKLDVGNRLALWALAKTYGKKDLVYSGPLYKSMAVEGNKARLSFAHVGGGLKSRDGKPLSEFQIAGADGKFVPAEAMIDGSTVVVQTSDVAAPRQVRFGWHNTANPNLMNAEGLPASPFQTNDWHGGTGE